MSPMAGNDGYRRVVQPGNVNQNLSWQIKALQPENTYYWSVQAVDNSFAGGPWAEEQQFSTTITALDEQPEDIPAKIALEQNYPNPFNPKTIINYDLPITNYVNLSIYSLLGQKVATLVDKEQTAGSYKVEWDARGFATGVYYYKLNAGDFQQIKKMVLIK